MAQKDTYLWKLIGETLDRRDEVKMAQDVLAAVEDDDDEISLELANLLEAQIELRIVERKIDLYVEKQANGG